MRLSPHLHRIPNCGQRRSLALTRWRFQGLAVARGVLGTCPLLHPIPQLGRRSLSSSLQLLEQAERRVTPPRTGVVASVRLRTMNPSKVSDGVAYGDETAKTERDYF
jgi:hypothetical protein